MQEHAGAKKPKVVVIGLDALTFDVIEPWIAEGFLPNLAAIAAQGARGDLLSCYPPLSPPAWTTITTGRLPGSHGIFNFSVLHPGTYKVDTVDARQVRVPRLWDMLNRHGLKTGVFNVPVTWPPTPLDGYMVGGFLTPDVRATFTYPEALGREVHEVSGGYRTMASQVFSATHQMPYLQELRELVEMRTGVVEHLIRTQPTDFAMFVFMEADWLQHKVFHLLANPEDRGDGVYPAARAVFAALDVAVGKIMAACGPDCNYLVISDHGAGLHDRIMHINKWLYDEGFLVLKRTFRLRLKRFLERRKTLIRAYGLQSRLRARAPWIGRLIPRTLNALANGAVDFFTAYDDVDWSRTRAYGRDVIGQIYVNRKGREPEGIIGHGPEYDALLDEIEERLKRLLDPRTGKPIISGIRRGRDLYHGLFASEGPDLVFTPDDFRCTASVRFGFDTEGYFGDIEFCDSGSHRPKGIFMACGPHILPGSRIEGAAVQDVTPTVLHLMGLPVPEDLDGRPIEEILTPEFRRSHPVRRETAEALAAPVPVQADGLSETDRDELNARLRDLGYL
ncbi:MAG: alkaline phosphatase family protein [Phycisphaerae bacterium]